MARDKVKLDIFWLRDRTLEDSANLYSSYPPPIQYNWPVIIFDP
jgi:hypothetical protein